MKLILIFMAFFILSCASTFIEYTDNLKTDVVIKDKDIVSIDTLKSSVETIYKVRYKYPDIK